MALENGASFIVKGGAGTSTSAVFTRSAAKNTAAGSNSLLAGSFSAGAPAVGMLVTNTTAAKASKAWIYTTAGGSNWNITQPLVPNVPVTGLTGVEVDTWASTDTVTLTTPIAINVVDVDATSVDDNGSFTNGLYLYNMIAYDPEAQGDTIAIGNGVFIQEVVAQRFVSYYAGTQTAPGARIAANLFSTESMQSNGSATIDPIFLGGALSGSLGSAFIGDPLFSSDPILGGGGGFTELFIGGDTHNAGIGGSNNGNIYLDGPLTLISGRFQVGSAGSVVYGNSTTGTIELFGSAHLENEAGSTFVPHFTAPLLISPGFLINGLVGTSTACSATSAGAINCGITTTPAHLDAAAGAAGFGGAAFVFGGPSVANF